MNALIKSIEAEYRRYRSLAEAAIEQVPEEMLSEAGPGNGNSLAIICWHVSGNLKSRFTDFLDSDGEKPWRERDEEFAERSVSRAELMKKWNEGWDCFLNFNIENYSWRNFRFLLMPANLLLFKGESLKIILN